MRALLTAVFFILGSSLGAAASEAERLNRFIIAGTVFTLHHEAAHMLIDAFELPITGREEDAADQYAWLRMLPERPHPYADALVRDAILIWKREAIRARREDDRVEAWSEHGTDMQRHFMGHCMAAGLAPETFATAALDAGLPAERLEDCESDANNAAYAWEVLLEDLPLAGQGRVRVVYDAPPAALRSYGTLARRAVDQGNPAGWINARFELPGDVTIHFQSCGEPDAHFDPETSTILFCYEEMAKYRRLFRLKDDR